MQLAMSWGRSSRPASCSGSASRSRRCLPIWKSIRGDPVSTKQSMLGEGAGQTPLDHLCTLELQYRPGMTASTSPEGKIGQYLGSGDGTVNGPWLQGRIRWD